MKKILVPVDFSPNSRKAIRFAIQFASQINAEIIFFHIINITSASPDSVWPYYVQFQEDEVMRCQYHLSRLIKKVYNKNLPFGINYECVSEPGGNIGDEILSYAETQKVDFICVGTSGTSILSKLFGTVATHLMVNSPIPVFVIPKNYRHKPLIDICYASDMANPEIEIKKVHTLAMALQATINVLHFDYEIGLKENKKKLNEIAHKFESNTIHFQYKKLNALYPLKDHLRKAIMQMKPSLLVLFTKQNRNWFNRLILSGNSPEMSFRTKVPLLVIRKTTNE